MADDKYRSSHTGRQLDEAIDAAGNALVVSQAAESTATQALSAANNAISTADDALGAAEEATQTVEQLSLEMLAKVDGGYVEDGYLYLTANDEIVVGPLGPFSGTGGSGGGGGNSATLTVSNTSGWLARTVAYGASCPVSVNWSSVEDGIETGAGTLTVTVNGTVKATKSINQGDISIDLADYLAVGSNTVKLKVSDVYGNNRTINFSITTVSVSLTSTFDASTPFSGAFTFPYTPTGSVVKTMHFILDNVEIGTTNVSTSGRQQSYIIAAQSNGTHTLAVYFTATIDGEDVTSNELFYEFMVCDDTYTEPLIASSFRETEVEQYTSVVIPWYVYVPGSLTASEVVLAANGSVVNTLTNVDRSEQSWTYRADTAGTTVLTITCDGTTKSISLTVNESIIEVEAETEDLSLFLSSYGRSNSEAEPSVWSYGNIAAELTDFNFASDGWQTDEDGITVLRVAGDARVKIPLKIFESDFRGTGKTIELEFATRDVRNYDSAILSCMSGSRGIELTAQLATFKSEQSELTMQYKEEEHVRLSIVVEKRSENRLIYCYINGIMSGVAQYPTDDDFSQIDPVEISIGSNDCTMDIYCIRVYDNDLTRYQILDNWIADTQNGETMLERYSHNNVYDAYGQIVIGKLPSDLPYLVLQGTALPQYKGNKLSITGYYVNPLDSSKNFTFSCTIDVQGTSSAGYARKNYKMKFSSFVDDDGNTAKKYSMRSDSVPTNTFTMKADVASSEGCNNVELVRLYNDVCPYRTPPQIADSRIRQGIDGFPIVIFWDNGSDITFLGKYNFNNDKGTDEVYGFTSGDESWETLNNTSDRTLWKNADFSGTDWQNDYEARYPEDNTDVSNLSALAAWLVSTDQTKATGAALSASVTYDGTTYTADTAAYRLARFKAEFENHFVLDSAVFYYVFTELFLMVDSRAKNSFPSLYMVDGKWCFLPYDMDTAIGINNEGALAFSYNLEDIDTTESGADVFNGQQSVLWVNLRAAFYDKITEMYQEIRSTGAISYDVVEKAFEEHQAKWPEAIFNEDAYFKYIQPLLESGTASYLSMCQGSKAEQRKWWLYNRFRYLDSKYNAGDALSDIITLRGYEKSDITVTPYADIYAAVKYGSYLVQNRAARNRSYTLACPLDNVNDTEIYIYSCSQLADVGDLSGLKVGYADFSMAVKLRAIKIGDSSNAYSNANLTELYLGNNTLLQTVDSRNCPNLTQTIDLSGCTGIEECYFTGTAIPSLALPNGGVLKKLYLPATITNLTIRNQPLITDFGIQGSSQITTLWIENTSTAVDSKAIVSNIVANSRVRLIGVDWRFDTAAEVETLYDILDTMRGLDESGNNTDTAQVSGKIHIPSITGTELESLKKRYTNITITYDSIAFYVFYLNADGTLLYTDTVAKGANAIDPVTTGKISAPTKTNTNDVQYTYAGWDSLPANIQSNQTVTAKYSESYAVRFYNGSTLLYTDWVASGGTATYGGSTPTKTQTAQYTYTHSGWSTTSTGSASSSALTNVTAARNVYAVFKATTRTYTVYFYNGSTLLQTVPNVAYGSSATYTGSTPVSPDGSAEDYPFEGWSPAPTNITGTTSCYAVFGSPAPAFENTDFTLGYGVEWDYSQSATTLTRIGLASGFGNPAPATSLTAQGSSPFDSVLPWSGMKRYNVIDGAISYSEDDAGFSMTDYDTVVYIPPFYYAAYKDEANSKWRWSISPTEKEGYALHPGSGRYIGRYHTSGDSSAVFSKSGVQPLVSTSRTNFRTYSHNKGDEWWMIDIATWSALQLLFLVEFANFHSQSKLGYGNGNSSQALGSTDSAVYHTYNGGSTTNQYRWIEQPWGRVCDWVDGFIASSRVCYLGTNNSTFSDATTNLTNSGVTLPSSAYITGLGYSDKFPWAFLPDTGSGGGSSTYIPDYVSSNSGPRALYVGGFYYGSGNYGLFSFDANNNASSTYASIGSRLLYIP